MTASALVPHSRTSVAEARRMLRQDLIRSRVVGRSRDDILLVLSELLSNAVKHARPLHTGGLRVSWSVTDSEVEVAVTDGGSPTAPTASAAAMSALGGRGLNIVDQLVRTWDVVSTEKGTTVWAAVSRHPVRTPS